MCGYVLFVTLITCVRLRWSVRCSRAGRGGRGPGHRRLTTHTGRTRSRAATDGTVLYMVLQSPVRSASRIAIMSAGTRASRCGPGWGVQIPHPRPRCSQLGRRTGNDTLHVGVAGEHAGEPHPTRHATLTSTGLLHCFFWCAASGSGATAIQLGEVHHAKRGATGAHSMRSGATGAHSMRSGAAGALEHA
jgi:hypothetical protein